MPAALCAALLLVASAVGSGQTVSQQGCGVSEEYDPVLVANPGGAVSFLCANAAPYQAIQAAGRQARAPIGVVPGRDPRLLFAHPRSFALRAVDVETALREAVRGTSYTVARDGEVWLVLAGDVTPRQRRLLHLQLTNFAAVPGSSLSDFGQSLTMWLQVALHSRQGFMLGGISSMNEEGFTLPVIASATTEEIANRIVQLGPKGMWVLRADAVGRRRRVRDVVEIESYQHFSNRPIL